MHMQRIIPEKYNTGNIIPKNMLIDCIFIAQNKIIISIPSVEFTYELVWVAEAPRLELTSKQNLVLELDK